MKPRAVSPEFKTVFVLGTFTDLEDITETQLLFGGLWWGGSKSKLKSLHKVRYSKSDTPLLIHRYFKM